MSFYLMCFLFCRDVVNTNTSNDSDKSDRTVVDVSMEYKQESNRY